ncbi:hypothetical protein [Streptomyces sp. NRRL B-3648]|uniref:hypothetical protein n=1 Tax=Streptomyces sp. NRRL B-3648 TaxID=1519493 RepID=UPI0006B0527F|nr:hypothetical protein [Streptomyces sp. NRRL B-3648]KOX01368.1 hypothetical protein ADL04_13640 [Streptomyces sp. NRRL B-3648]
MPEQTPPPAAPPASPGTPPAASGTGSRGLGCLGCAGLVFVAVVALFIQLTWDSPRDLPRTAPGEMARRAVRHSQEAYDVLGFTRTVPPGAGRIGVDAQNTLDAGDCYDGGLLGLEDETIDGAYEMGHDWALDDVPASQAVPGLRRLHRRLQEDGWEVSSYREGGKDGQDWSLFVQRDGGDERMSFTWFPDRRYFTGGATAPCAYDPGWTEGDGETWFPGDAAASVSPPALGPGRP